MTTLASPSATLVCHELPPADRLPRLLRDFDALFPGQSLELQSDHAPNPALTTLQRERPGLFEWSPLQAGPGLWRTRITRRTGPAQQRWVTQALEWDHDRLDSLERDAFAARAAGDVALATLRFHEFALGLRRHIGLEEKLLFPVFESRAGSLWENGPTHVMRLEHREIEARLDELQASFADLRDPLTDARAALHQLLHEHNEKEERVLYPATDRLLGEEERDEILKRIQAFVG